MKLLDVIKGLSKIKENANPKFIKGKLHYKSLNGEWKPCLYHNKSRKERGTK